MIATVGLYYFLLSALIAVVSIVVYLLYSRRHVEDQKTADEKFFAELQETEFEEPDAEEKRKLDREYNIWKIITIALLVVTFIVWIVAFIV